MKKNYEKKHLILSMVFPTLFLLTCWVVHFYSVILKVDLFRYGIYPEKLSNLFGIFFSPFIHADFNHLISNTFPFFILGTGVFYFYPKIAYRVILQIWLLSGIAVWLTARESYHIGASGLIYGFAAFLVFGGILHKNRMLSVISLVVIFLYGSIVWGIFPGQESVSWESHLSGFVVGILSSLWYSKMSDEKIPEIILENPVDEEFRNFDVTDIELRNFYYTYIEKKEDSI